MLKNLEKKNTLLNQFIAELRDKDIQQDRLRFRRNLERIGEIFAYEISKTLDYKEQKITTPLGVKRMMLPERHPVLATILRAGLPLHNGLLNYFDRAGNAFVSAYRKYESKTEFDIHMEYVSSPDINDNTLIISDPMLATASSMVLSYRELLRKGQPRHTHIVTIVASTQGVEKVQEELKGESVTLWTGAIDDELTDKAYIVPGLGDAGDLAYGGKL